MGCPSGAFGVGVAQPPGAPVAEGDAAHGERQRRWRGWLGPSGAPPVERAPLTGYRGAGRPGVRSTGCPGRSARTRAALRSTKMPGHRRDPTPSGRRGGRCRSRQQRKRTGSVARRLAHPKRNLHCSCRDLRDRRHRPRRSPPVPARTGLLRPTEHRMPRPGHSPRPLRRACGTSLRRKRDPKRNLACTRRLLHHPGDFRRCRRCTRFRRPSARRHGLRGSPGR
jgi:hypothetical protein